MAAVLRPLVDKYLTQLNNPQWLLEPIEKVRGRNGVFEVRVPSNLLYETC
jgi:hypothetical protein